MRIIRSLAAALAAVTITLSAIAAVRAQTDPQSPRQPPKQQTEYVPIDQLPPQEQMPAAPLLVGAYSFVLVVLFLYVLSVARRLRAVGHDIARLEGELKKGTGT